MAGVDPNACIDPADASWADIDAIVEAREHIADVVIDKLIENGLTVMAAKDVLFRATARIEAAVKGCPVGQLSIPRTSRKDG